MPFIRSISGLRATIGDSLLPEIIAQYSAAFSESLPEGKIIIGRDGRPTGKWIEQIIQGTLAACGRECCILGVVPTPTVQLMVENSDAIGGIVITASHNPSQWNGMKFISNEGVFLDAEQNHKLWDIVDNQKYNFSQNVCAISQLKIENPVDEHINAVLEIPIFTNSKNINIFELIKKRKFKVVVDTVNASGSVAVPELLKKFGCEVVKLYCDESGIFPHTPEPLPINLTELAKAVTLHKADLGIAVDPDADRLVLIDETGNPIGEEKTIALAVMSVLRNKELFTDIKYPKAVVNHSTTGLVEYIASKYDAKVERSPVGEINVVKLMKSNGAIIGGEGSGGVILPACHYGRDSLVGIALLLALLSQENKSLNEITSQLPNYQMVKVKIDFTGDINILIDKLIKQFDNGKIIKEDGLKIIFKDSWVQVRSSNTEPIIRIIAESTDLSEAQSLVKKISDIV